MANRLKLKGTTEKSFDFGLSNKFTLDASGFTANRTWTLPDSNGTAGYVLSTNGSGVLSWVAQTGGGGTPGGSNTQVQFNNSGAFGGDADFTYDSTNNVLTIGKAVIGSQFGGTALTSNDVANPLYIVGANKTGTGGTAQTIEIVGGSGAGTNNNGGNLSISSGAKSGTGTDGNIDINGLSGYVNIRNSVGAELDLATDGSLDIVANGGLKFNGSVGTAGQVLTSSGAGNPTWTSIGAGASQARIQFTAGSSAAGQTFTNSGISSFTNNTFANVFVNGVLLQTSEYSISGTTLTVSRYLSTGDNIIVAATGAGSVVGTLATTSGGTGLSTYTTGDIIYASGTNTLAKRAIGTTNQLLAVSGGVPTWTSNVTLTQYQETAVAGGSVSGTITPNAASGTIYNYTLTGNITLNAITNVAAGTSMTIILTQGGSGSYTLTSSWKFAGGSKTLSTAVGAVDIISVFYDGTTYYASLTTGYA